MRQSRTSATQNNSRWGRTCILDHVEILLTSQFNLGKANLYARMKTNVIFFPKQLSLNAAPNER